MRIRALALLLLAVLPQDSVQDRLKAAATYLASDELKGRQAGTPEGEKAARWMAEQFEKIGLKQAGSDGYFQKFKTKGENSVEAINVFGRIEGMTDELVAICCHHDHIGVRNGVIHNGADDNASGCAVLLEIARLCVASKEKPKRGLLFCSFDAEESMLLGSRYFVGSGLVDMSRVAALICMDMMGGNFFPRDTTSLYALGAENSPEIREALAKVPKVEGLDVRPMGVHVIEPMGEMLARSDYGSFRQKKVPFVFFSTGQPWHYHKPEDDVERLNFDKMERGVRFVHRLLLDLAALEARPTYQKQPGLTIDDLKAIADIVRRFHEHPEDLDLKENELAGLNQTMAALDEIIKAGRITPKDTDTLQGVASALMGLAARRSKEDPRTLPADVKFESFDRDPGWDGRNNRSATPEPRKIRQDFGWAAGKVGGLVTPAAEPAYYGKKIPAKSFDDPLRASGTLVMEPGAGNTLVGFFNAETVNEWRTPSTIAFRLNGRGEEGFHVHLEYATARWRAGGVFYGEKKMRMFPPGKYAWSLVYGNGTITATLNGEPLVLPLDPGHKGDGATFTRFGLLNVMKSADSGGTLWLDDVEVNGERDAFDVDPGWESFKSRAEWTTANVRPRFDFGFSATRHAGGSAGELGGLIYRGDERYPDRMAYYGDRLRPLTLDKPLKASGKVSLRRGVTDSTVLLGFFHSSESMRQSKAQQSGIPENFLGVAVEGPSREGFLFYPIYGVDREAEGGSAVSDPRTPHILPDGASHSWTLEYSPADSGTITVTFDGRAVSLPISKAHRALGAKFDRFGIVTTHIDGNAQHIFFDDLSYTWDHGAR